MEEKTFLQYIAMTIQRAFRKAWEKFGASGTAIGLAISSIASYIAKQPASLRDFGLDETLLTIGLFLILFITVIIWFTFRELIVVYNEQVSHISELQESSRPLLELRFEEDHASSIQGRAEKMGIKLYRVLVVNKSNTNSIEDLNVKVIKVTPNPSLTILPADLSIMNNQDKRLNPGDRLFVDVLMAGNFIPPVILNGRTTSKPGIRLCFVNKELQFTILPFQTTEFVIQATGNDTPAIQKTFEFYVDENRAFGLREKTSDTL